VFAVLGEIPFEVIGSPESLESSRVYEYAEHKVVEDRPRLQWVADGLETITLEMLFHVSFTDPAAQLALLLAAAGDHNARPLVFGNGLHRGYFVVTSISTTSRQLSPAGDPIAIFVRVQLKEWSLGVEMDPNAPPLPSTLPVGVVTAEPGATPGAIPYSVPQGISVTAAALIGVYAPPPLAAPGVSPLLNNPSAPGIIPANAIPSDIPTSRIVRAAQ
jgi:phage protein U